MPEILIRVRDKLPVVVGDVRHIVADNSDYTIRFEFDELWNEGEKTVYLVRSRGFVYPKMQTENDSIAVPVQSDVEMTETLLIGVQQGDVKTSRSCELRILPAITDFIEDGAVQPEKSMWEDHESRIADLEENGTGTSYDIGYGLELSEDGRLLSAEVGKSSFVEITDERVLEIFSEVMEEQQNEQSI